MTIGALTAPLATRSLNAQAGPVALAVAQPADPGRQPLEGDLLAGAAHPLLEAVVVREQVHHRAVGRVDVLRVTGERHPAERALALAEQRPDVRRDEAREVEGPVVAALPGLVADRVAVVEDLGALVQEPDHRLHVPGHRLAGPVGELLRLALRVVVPVGHVDPLGQVRQRVVRRGLVGDDVDLDAAPEQLGEHRGGVADDADAVRAPVRLGVQGQGDGLVEVVGHDVEVAVLDTAVETGAGRRRRRGIPRR